MIIYILSGVKLTVLLNLLVIKYKFIGKLYSYDIVPSFKSAVFFH